MSIPGEPGSRSVPGDYLSEPQPTDKSVESEQRKGIKLPSGRTVKESSPMPVKGMRSRTDSGYGSKSLSSSYDISPVTPNFPELPDSLFLADIRESPSPESDVLPIRLERATLGKEAGKGEFSRVHWVTQEQPDGTSRNFVLKVFLRDKDLAKEQAILEKLEDHEHIAGFHGFVTVGDQTGLLFEAIKGPILMDLNNNLVELYDNGKISSKELRDALVYLERQKLKPFVHLKQNGIVHADVKPNNFIYDQAAKKLKLIDFGLAVSHGKHVVCGHADYMAPEVVKMLKEGITPAWAPIDLYAIGQMSRKLFKGLDRGLGDSFLFGMSPDALSGLRNELPTALWFELQRQEKGESPRSPALTESDLNIGSPSLEAASERIKHASSMEQVFEAATQLQLMIKQPLFDYVMKLMEPNPDKRMTAEQALQHPWLNPTDYDEDAAIQTLEEAANMKEFTDSSSSAVGNPNTRLSPPPPPK